MNVLNFHMQLWGQYPESNLSHSIERTIAYSMIALKMLKIHVMINLSIALSLLLADDGALDLKKIFSVFSTR